MTKFTRHASFTNLTEPKKQYKYFHHLLIPNVREINRLKLFRYEGSVDDRLEPTDVLPIFGWTIRDISSDANWYVEAADKDVMVDFVQEVHKKIFMDFGRDIHWPGFTITDITSHNLREILKKHIRRVLSKEQETSEKTKIISEETPVSRSFAFATLGRRSALGLRRTASHVGSSFARLAVPFRGHRSANSNATVSSFPENLDAPYVLCADDPIDATCLSFPFSEAELVPTARCGSKTMMPLSEETEKAFEFENSDKEN